MFKREGPKQQMPKLELKDIALPAVREYAPRASRYAEEAAQSRQYVLDLEAAVEAMQGELSKLRSHVSVIEEANALLHERVVELEKKNAELAHINTVHKTRVEDAARLILDLVEPVPPKEKSSDPGRSNPPVNAVRVDADPQARSDAPSTA